MSRNRIRVVAALLKNNQGQVLVQQRGAQRTLPLLWEFPGGKIEPGESEEEALRRECQEELGVEVEVGSFLDRNIHQYIHQEVELLLYECHLKRGEPSALHDQALAYVPIEKLSALAFCEADVPFIGRLLKQAPITRGT